MKNVDLGLVDILAVQEKTKALVRVKNLLHLNAIENSFPVCATYPFIRSVVVECDINVVERLSKMSEVEHVFAQGRVMTLDGNTALDAEKINDIRTQIIESYSVDKQLNGEGVTLCVVDTGVAPHIDISMPKNRIKGFYDVVGSKEYPYDDNGHGTFVAGVACGNGMLSGEGIVGIAPRAEIVGIKAIGSSGQTGTFKILDGMQWLFDNHRKYGIKVACMSFGADPSESADPLKLGAEMLVKSGLTVVCSAGNSGKNSIKSPAVSPAVISVGACDSDGSVAEFSSTGIYQGVRRPDVYSIGIGVKGIDAGGTHTVMTGTSVSAPYVAGACCLLHQKYKNLSPALCKSTIIAACKKVKGMNILQL